MDSKSQILVAEDNDFVRMQIVRFLNDAGYDTHEAKDGGEAIDIVKAHNPDLAIVDVRMEPLNGFDFIRSVRGMDIQIPVILVTGDNSPDLLEKSSEWGVGAILIKPVEKDRLISAVGRSLQMAQRRAR